MSKKTEEVIKKLSSKNVPIITLDKKWHDIFPDKKKTPEIKKMEERVNELLKKQGKINTDLKDLKKIKAQTMQEIVELGSADIPENSKNRVQEQNQKKLMEINKQMEKLEDEGMDVPRELNKANLELVAESMQECHRVINKNRNDIEVLDGWINQMRYELKKRILIKQDKETRNEEMYTYMHDVLGPEVMEVFDEKNT